MIGIILSDIEPEAFFTVSEETELFLLSVLLGGGLGVLYDVFRALRVVFPPLGKPAATAVCDVIFFLCSGYIIYLFSLLCARGEVRGFFWAGALLGGIIYLLTAGTVVMGIIRTVMAGIVYVTGKLRLAAGKAASGFGTVFRHIMPKALFNRKKPDSQEDTQPVEI